MITFYTWITKQNYRDDKIGDLARDIIEDTDKNLPKAGVVIDMWLDYLKIKTNDDVNIRYSCKAAWLEYELLKEVELSLGIIQSAVKRMYVVIEDKNLKERLRISRLDNIGHLERIEDLKNDINSIKCNAEESLDRIEEYEQIKSIY